MSQPYTAIVKQSGSHFVALCLELNVAAQGETLLEARAQLRDAITEYLAYMEEIDRLDEIRPVSVQDLREFLFDDEEEKMYVDEGVAFSEHFSFEVAAGA